MPFRLLDDEPEKLETEITPQQPTRIGRFRLLEEETEIEETPEEQSVFRQVADIPLGIARGGVTGIKMMTDILGADNPVSKSLSGVEGYMADLMSAQSKEDQQEISRIMKDAEDKGFGEQVKAGIKAFSIAPVDIMSQALGTMAPVLATGLAGSAAKLGALGIRAVQTGVGAGMGAGMIKGEIYNEVKNELINSGTPEELAEKAAVDAQSYGGKNLDQILLGAGLGAASTLGAERILTRLITKQGVAPSAGIISRTLKGGFTEAIPEGVQAAQEQLAKNVALQREGFDVDPSRGVVAAATMEAIAGAPLGGIAGAIESPAKVKTLEEEKFEQTNEIARNVAENGAPLTASALQDKAAANLNQDELARKLDEELSLTAVKPTAAPVAIPTKDEYVARYSAIAQTAPEELTRAEQSFTNELATADTEEKRINAQNALDAIKEVKAVGITPAAQPVTPVTQPPTIDATQEIIQQQGVRQEPQDRTQIGATTEAGVSDSLLGAEGIQEEGQVDPIVSGLQAVANNTATSEQIASLSMQGLVDIRRGQAIINEDGEGVLAQAQATLPKLTPEERVAEVEATQVPKTREELVSELEKREAGKDRLQELTSAGERIAEENQILDDILGIDPNSKESENLSQREKIARLTPEQRKEYGNKLGSLVSQRFTIIPAPVEATPRQLPTDVLPTETPGAEYGREAELFDVFGGVRRRPVDVAEPIIGEKPQVSPIVGEQVEETAPVEQVAETQITEEPIISEKPQTSEIVGAETPTIVEQEQVVPAETQAPKVVPVQRDVTKPEQMTPEEFVPVGNPANQGIFKSKKEASTRLAELEETISKSSQMMGILSEFNLVPSDAYQVAKDENGRWSIGATHKHRIAISAFEKQPVSATAVENYGIKLPQGYSKQGDLYVFKAGVTEQPVGAATPVAEAAKATAPAPLAAPEPTEIETDPVRIQEIKNSIQEGNLILRTGKFNGKKLSPEKLASVQRSVTSSLAKLGETPAVTEAPAPNVAPAPDIKSISDSLITGRVGRLYEQANQVSGGRGTSVGSGGVREQIEAASLVEMRKAIDNGASLQDAASLAKASSREMIKSHNAKRKGDVNWQINENYSDSQIDRTASDILDVQEGRSEIGAKGYIVSKQPTAPAVSETITEPAAQPTQPEGIAVGNRIQLGKKSPQTYIVEEVLPQSESKIANEEQSYLIRNENTGEVSVSGSRGMFLVGGKKARKMAIGTITPRTQEETDALNKASSNKVMARNPELSVAAVRLKNGEITAGDYADLIDRLDPFTVKGAEQIPIDSKIKQYIDESKIAKVNAPIENGKEVEFRIDIPTYNRSTASGDTVYAVTAHEPVPETSKRVGEPISYVGVAKVINPRMMTRSISGKGKAIDIATGSGKFPLATVKGNYEAITELPVDINDANVWTEVSYNPIRSSYFVDVRSKNAVVGGDEAIMVGSRVFVKNPQIEARPQGLIGEDGRYMMDIREQQEAVTPIPEANRYTYEEAVRLVDSYFDKEGIPEGIVIVNNTTEPDLEMKAGYFVDRGQIVINLAYIAKGENLSDIISHELGHFIFSDPQFQADFKAFWDLMTPEEQADADRIINQFYNKETGAVQMEEKQVRAFMQLIQDSKAMPKWKQLLDSIKRWINEKLGTNFLVTDRGALSVLAAAHKRFKSGERIIREIDSGVLKMAAEPKREQVGGMNIGKAITTPPGITKMTQNVIKAKFFNGSTISDENTALAFVYIQQLLDKKDSNGNKLAGLVNNVVDDELVSKYQAMIDAGTVTEEELDFEKRMGASLFRVELMNYASRLAAQGDVKMFRLLRKKINSIPSDEYAGGLSEEGRSLNTAKGYDISGYTTFKIEQESNVDRLAAALFGTSKPTEEQRNIAQKALEDSEDVEYGSAEEIAAAIEDIEERTKRPIIKAIDEKIKESTKPKKEELLISFENLDADRKIKRITIKYNPQKVNVAKNIKDFIIGKMVDYRKTLVNQGAGGLESTFWQTMSASENKPGPLGELDQAQNNELAKIVKDTLIKLKLKGEPPNTKMTDIEKVASILNENKLSDEKRLEADSRIVEEIERRRQGELASGSSPEAVNAKYDVILDAWNEAMSRQLNMPISDNMLQRLLKSEIKERNTQIGELINENDGRVVEEVKNDIVDSIIRRVYGVSKEFETGIEMDEDYTNLQSYLKQTLNNMYATAIDKKNAAYAKRQAQISLRGNVEGQAQSIINQLADQMTDTPAFPQKQENQVKTIVQQDLRQRPNMGRKQPWTSQLTAKLIDAGVNETQAQTIAELTWRQHEIKAMDRELKELQTAAEKGSLAVIVQRIKDTPLAMQQEPNWMQGVIREYLVEAGLSEKAAETAAKLYESVISERFAEAKQKAFEAALNKSAPWNNFLSRNVKLGKDALKKIQEAIRTGVLDPTQTTESIIAKQNGWSGFSKEQLTRIVQLDDILSDSNTNQVTKAEAMSELNKIIVKAKMPVRFKDAISSFYVAQALMGIPTFTVNIASPTFFAIRNLAIDVARYAATDPQNIPVAFQSFMDSMQNWKDNSLYAFKNQIYMSGEIEYMQGQNVLRELFDKGMGQWKKGEYANGMANMLVGMTQITGRVLSSLDQGAIAMMESQNIPRYALDAMASNKKIPKDKRKEIANIALYGRSRMRQDLIESGMSPERAGVLADLQMRSELMAALSEYGISKTEVLDASLNDALQSVGRNRVITTEGFKQSRDNLRDAGITSGLAIGFLENLASNANRGGQAQQIFARMLYGFALVPARVFSTALWFSPVGFIRLGVDSLLKKAGIESRYAMSLATELQYKQRVYESIAGTVLLGALASLVKSSTDDEDDELPFKIVATGNGPNYTTDPQYYDSWNKRNKPGELSMYFGKTKFTLNIGRGGEAVSIPFMIAGAFDDWNIKSKQNAAKNSPKDLEMAAEVLGSAFYAYAQRGPWAAFGRPLFDAKKQDKLIPDLFGKAAYLGKTFVPILGSSLSRNISDFINDPIDKSSVQGAIYANTPVIGPMFGTKALNALGQPIRGDDWNDRLFKIGVPLVFSFPKNTPENDLNILILKKGDGPAIPTRTNAQKKFGDVITDKEFEIYVREYGRVVSDKMFKNRKRLETMESKNYIKELDKYVNGYSIDGINVSGASDMAVRAVKRSRNQ